MRARVLALAVILSGLTAGGLYFVNWNTGSLAQDSIVGGFGMLEVVDRGRCDVSACAGSSVCLTAQNFLNDAGSPCQAGFINCPIRVGQRLRNLAADAGIVLGPQKYQRARIGGERCPVDGGQGVAFAYGVPVDDNGWPVLAFVQATSLCRRRPSGTDVSLCHSASYDGGTTDFSDTQNVMQPGAWVDNGGCQAVECSVMYGDDPDTDL